MGEVSDIEDLLPKALRDVRAAKRARVLWALGTAVFTVLSTTATVSWTLRGYVDDLRHANEQLRGSILVMDKKIEALEQGQKEIREIRERADRALLLAQLAQKGPTP